MHVSLLNGHLFMSTCSYIYIYIYIYIEICVYPMSLFVSLCSMLKSMFTYDVFSFSCFPFLSVFINGYIYIFIHRNYIHISVFELFL